MKRIFKYVMGGLVMVTSLTQFAWAEAPRHLSTGIGIDQRQDNHEDYSTKILFFVTGGAYLADMEVTIKDKQGNLIYQGTSSGPWFFIDLPPGDYQVIGVRGNGDTQSARFHVATNGRTAVGLLYPLEQR